jgi:hypothetical protein
MKRLLLLPVLVFVTVGAATVHAASPRPAPHVPVVATWFSDLRPTSGAREVLSVQLSRDSRGLAGGHFSATIRSGSHVLHLRGGTTNGHGTASVAFTVPHGVKGTVLRATTTVAYQGQSYRGSNQVTVARSSHRSNHDRNHSQGTRISYRDHFRAGNDNRR